MCFAVLRCLDLASAAHIKLHALRLLALLQLAWELLLLSVIGCTDLDLAFLLLDSLVGQEVFFSGSDILIALRLQNVFSIVLFEEADALLALGAVIRRVLLIDFMDDATLVCECSLDLLRVQRRVQRGLQRARRVQAHLIL